MNQRRSEPRSRKHRPARQKRSAPPLVLDEELRAEISEVAGDNGCELVHAELAGDRLRLFIDRSEGVNLSDCERVSRQVSALLDVVDFGTGRYVLEVSSPGLDRQLHRRRDYERFTGHLVRVTFREPESGGKRTVVGRLTGFERHGEASGLAAVEVPESGERLRLGLEEILAARLEVEL